MVDESRFRYRRDAGSNDAGARGAPPRDPRLEPGRDPGQRPPAAAPRPSASTADARPAAAPPRAPAPPRPAPQQGRLPDPSQGRTPAPQPAGRAAASQGGDPLAELARLIAEQDPFADFGDLPPQTAQEPAPRAAAPAARPFDPRRDLRAPARAPEPADDDTFDEPPPRRAAVPRPAVPPEPAARQPLRRAPEPPASRSAPEAAAPRPAAAPARPQPPAFLTHPAAGAGQPQPGARAPQEPVRRQAALNPPPSRPALVPPRSDAAPVDRSATSVRLGYGSLAHQAQVPPPQPAPARSGDAARLQEPQRTQEPKRIQEPPRAAQRPAAAPYEDEEDAYEEAPRRAPAPEARPQAEPRSATYAYSAERRQNDDYDEYDDAYDPQYDEDGYMPPHGEEVYEGETHRRKGRAALLLVASVLGLIVAGTAGVFAYRMAVHGTVVGSAGGPPVIRADTSPSKIVTPPAPATADNQQKMIYDRIGSAGNANERMVPREEQPVDVTTAAIRSGTPAATDPVISSLATEPKRVRTVPIRADAGSADTTVPALPSGGAANGPSSGVTALAAYAAGQAPGAPPSVVSLPSAKAPPQVSRTGEFVVQVASQRSEADAMGSWKALQTRYPNLLNSYVATVKKADLGDRGIYYRAQVGPFATKDQANDLCQALRAQGGDCLISKN